MKPQPLFPQTSSEWVPFLDGALSRRTHAAPLALLFMLLGSLGLAAAQTTKDVGKPLAQTLVPPWDARGVGPLPWQGVACVDLTADGKFVALGTMAPPGDPNVFLLDANGNLLEQHAVGQRWINEVAVAANGTEVIALCTSPTGVAGDVPTLFAFAGGKPVQEKMEGSSPLLFHYGTHSNHLARSLSSTGTSLVIARNGTIRWGTPGANQEKAYVARYPNSNGTILSLASSPSGRVVVGTVLSQTERTKAARNLMLLEKGKATPLWSRAVEDTVEAAPVLPAARYGPPAPPTRDFKAWAPLAVALDRTGQTVAAADYQGWERLVLPPDNRPFVLSLNQGKPRTFYDRLGIRFMPSRPTISVYDTANKVLRRFGPETFPEPFWCDLAFSADGQRLLVFPHNWTSRGLAGQPFLPADDKARSLYVLHVQSGVVQVVRFPDAISAVATGDNKIVVGCWDGRVYCLGSDGQPLKSLPDGLDVGAPSRVRISQDGKRILAATAQGVVWMLDGAGRELWRKNLNKIAKPGDKPWLKNQKAGKLGVGLWHVNSGRTPSDLGNQYVIEAPEGLILIDPNAGLSIEQNWARIKNAGLDPMKVKYVLATHEHGDHAPGAYLWRVLTGAKFVCSPEMAYTLQHDMPLTTGYGFHPPVPTDVIVKEDKVLDLAGFKIHALRLPGHTYGSMGWFFETGGKTYVSTGDLIMPGGVLGYSGSVNFKAADVLGSLKKLAALKPDVVLGGHGLGDPQKFIGAGIQAGETTGWGKMRPLRPNPFYTFTQKNYLVAAWLENIASATFGDVDGDGLPDVAVLTEGTRGLAVQVYLNKKGKFAETPDCVVDVPGLKGGFHIRMAHANKDGIADFLISTESAAALLISTQGKLDYRVVPLPGVQRAAALATSDFNGDGLTDCLIGQRFVLGYQLAIQKKDGTYQTVAGKGITKTYLDLQLADVNGDGKADLITSAGEIFLRQENGKLPDKVSLTLNHAFAAWSYLGIGDFNGDGKLDIVLLGKSGDRAQAAVFYNTGQPQSPFQQEPSIVLDLGMGTLLRDGPTVGDWNGDGVVDLVVANEQGKEAMILLGSKQAGLTVKNKVRVPLDYRIHYDTQLGLGDFTGQGKMDLAGFGHSITGAPGVYIWLQPTQQKK